MANDALDFLLQSTDVLAKSFEVAAAQSTSPFSTSSSSRPDPTWATHVRRRRSVGRTELSEERGRPNISILFPYRIVQY